VASHHLGRIFGGIVQSPSNAAGAPEASCFTSPIYGYRNSSCFGLALLLGDLYRLFLLFRLLYGTGS
jgi:hypothetical protein